MVFQTCVKQQNQIQIPLRIIIPLINTILENIIQVGIMCTSVCAWQIRRFLFEAYATLQGRHIAWSRKQDIIHKAFILQKYQEYWNEVNSMSNLHLFHIESISNGQCLVNLCLNGGTCSAYMSTYRCHCPSGFQGKHCEGDWISKLHAVIQFLDSRLDSLPPLKKK